jgi:hypothetical protein
MSKTVQGLTKKSLEDGWDIANYQRLQSVGVIVLPSSTCFALNMRQRCGETALLVGLRRERSAARVSLRRTPNGFPQQATAFVVRVCLAARFALSVSVRPQAVPVRVACPKDIGLRTQTCRKRKRTLRERR